MLQKSYDLYSNLKIVCHRIVRN